MGGDKVDKADKKKIFVTCLISIEQNALWCGDYGPVCNKRPYDYSYCDKMSIDFGNIDHYEGVHKIGRGKFSEVYLGYNNMNNLNCVIKVLKPTKSNRIYKEIKLLQALYGGPNIIKLTDVIKEKFTKVPCFVYEHMPY